ncbi:PLDc_N domain-containing protein [Candidatus Pacearchaeota archaeon]|nr:PLDc_N domain-containing protein [Candidatus Pacearchaeota archaeon]
MAIFITAVFMAVIALFAFWIWMIVDCAQRDFRDDTEKIVWILVIVLLSILGALVYFIAVKLYNPHGLNKSRKRH